MKDTDKIRSSNKRDYFFTGSVYCNATFDGYSCWNYTKAGTRAFGMCPTFLVYRFGEQECKYLELVYT